MTVSDGNFFWTKKNTLGSGQIEYTDEHGNKLVIENDAQIYYEKGEVMPNTIVHLN